MIAVLLWSIFVCSASLLYVTVGITFFSSLALTAIMGVLFYFFYSKTTFKIPFAPEKIVDRVFFLLTIVCDFFLACVAWYGRTDAPLRSPWSQIHLWFFCIFFISTALLVFTLTRAHARATALAFVALTTHIGLFFSVALIVFRYGYAYDPIIHQAAENYIVAHGKILPLQPFYIGQYAIVSALHFISRAPVWLIDRLLLPILTTLSIPFIGYIGFKNGWKLSERNSLIAIILLLVIPISEFTFTVPYNIAALYALWWILLLPLAIDSEIIGAATLFFLAAAAVVTHPLIGIPLLIGTIAALIIKKFPTGQKIIAPFAALAIGCGLAAMFGLYRMQQGLPFFQIISPLESLKNFIWIFSFKYDASTARSAIQLLYGFAYLLPFAVIFYGFWCAFRDKISTPITRSTATVLLSGIFLGIFFMSTLISIPNISSHEQNEFALRLASLLPVFALPFFVIAIQKFNRYLLFLFFPLVITTSFYFLYPTIDGITHPGFNVSAADLAIVHFIETKSAHEPHVVLSNQVLAAAGLRERGFEKNIENPLINTYPYAIGVDQPIYPLTQKILFTELNGEDARTLAHDVGGPVYVAIQNYWFRANEIATEARAAKPTAVYKFDGATVYEFR
ncbi:MAG: hypothetical protein NT003_04915 [Candidatus Magasanikbacteria bacterium]|nr:hypothetical protein [Candidatus Magasanikbacteria bacterium]